MKRLLFSALMAIAALGMVSCEGEFNPAKTGWKGSATGSYTDDGITYNTSAQATVVFGTDKTGFVNFEITETDPSGETFTHGDVYGFTYSVVGNVATLSVIDDTNKYTIVVNYDEDADKINVEIGKLMQEYGITVTSFDLEPFTLNAVPTLKETSWQGTFEEEQVRIVMNFSTDKGGVAYSYYPGEDDDDMEATAFSYATDGYMGSMTIDGEKCFFYAESSTKLNLCMGPMIALTPIQNAQ